MEEAGYRLAHLERFFAGRKIAAIGAADVTEQRRGGEAENGTIKVQD